MGCRHLTSVLIVRIALPIAFFTASAVAAPPAAPMATVEQPKLYRDVVQAYEKLGAYQIKISYCNHQRIGRWTQDQSTDLRMAYDRAAGKLLLDRPDLFLVIDGKKLLMKAEQFPGKHLEMDAPAKLDYQLLLDAVPVLSQPLIPDLVLLLAAEPVAVLSGSDQNQFKEVLPDAAGDGPRLEIQDQHANVWTFWIDPATHLVTQAAFKIDPTKLGSNTGDEMVTRYQMTIEKPGLSLEDSTFAIDVTGSKAVSSIQSLVQGGGRGDPSGKHELVGQEAPAISLQTIDGKPYVLADDATPIIILDFWATWCGPCRLSLPKLQAVYDWAQNENKPVAVYTVNLQEKPEQVTEFWKQNKLTLPVLMDPDTKAAGAYGVQSIPLTVVIHNGKVAHVQVGLDANMEEALKTKIDDLLLGRSEEAGDEKIHDQGSSEEGPLPPAANAPTEVVQ